jgi:hypothetical protein
VITKEKMFEIIKLSILVYIILQINEIDCKCERQSERLVKVYKIDLDKPASERFIEPVKDFAKPLLSWLETEKYFFIFNF